MSKDKDLHSYSLYQQFSSNAISEENNYLGKNNPKIVFFQEFLLRLYNSENTKNSQNVLCSKYRYFSMEPNKQQSNSFKEDNIGLVCAKIKEV